MICYKVLCHLKTKKKEGILFKSTVYKYIFIGENRKREVSCRDGSSACKCGCGGFFLYFVSPM